MHLRRKFSTLSLKWGGENLVWSKICFHKIFDHMRQIDNEFYWFSFFLSNFFISGFSDPFIVHAPSRLCLVNESCLNFFGTCPMFFFSSSRFLLGPYDVTITSNLIVHSFMQF